MYSVKDYYDRLREEQKVIRELFPEPITYVLILEDGTKVEVSKEEFLNSFTRPISSEITYL